MLIIEDLKNANIKEEYALYLFKGADLLMNAQYKEAILQFQEALKLRPDDSDVYYYLGVCNYYLEQFPEAIAYFKKIEETKSDDELYYYLGTSYYSLNRYPEAVTYLKKSLEANPDDAGTYAIIGTSNYLLGHLALAKENLDKAKELFKNQGDYLKAKEIEDYLNNIY